MLHKDKQIGRPQIPYQDTEANLNNLNLTSSDKGCISYATDTDKFLYWDGSAWAEVGGNVPDASTTEKGIVELATDAETRTGTATTVVITPANLTAATASEATASRIAKRDSNGDCKFRRAYLTSPDAVATSVASVYAVDSGIATGLVRTASAEQLKVFTDTAWDTIYYTKLAAAATTVAITGLSCANYMYAVYMLLYNPTGSATNYYAYIGDGSYDTNSAHYYLQYVNINGATVTAGTTNSAALVYAAAGETTCTYAYLMQDPLGYLHYNRFETRHKGSGAYLSIGHTCSTVTFTDVDRVEIVSSVASAIGIGSRIWLLRLRQ